MNVRVQDGKEGILVIGGRGTAANIAEQIEDAEIKFGAQQHCSGFLIDDPLLGTEINGFPILGKTKDVQGMFALGYKIIYALYKPSAMLERVCLYQNLGITKEMLATFVHPLASVMKTAKLSPGAVVLSGATIGNKASIGMASIINASVVVEHDTSIGNHNFIAAAAVLGSAVIVGDGNFIGLNTCVRENVKIGDNNVIGMGSVILSDIESNDLVFGCPGRSHRNHAEKCPC